MLQNTFTLQSVSFTSNSAYLGGGAFIAADLAANANLSSLTFSANAAALGTSVYWVRADSPAAALTCTGCAYAPASNDSVSTEPLTLAFREQPPTSVVSEQVGCWDRAACMHACMQGPGHHCCVLQVTAPFQVSLEDYYGHLSSAYSAGSCQVTSPSSDLLLSEQGRISGVQGGVSTFGLFEVSGAGAMQPSCTVALPNSESARCLPCAGGIGNSYALTATCALSTAGQLPYLPSSYNLSTLTFPIAVQKCGQGTEQDGSACKAVRAQHLRL